MASLVACSASPRVPDDARLGTVVQAVTSCSDDAACAAAGGFCNAGTCTPKLANGAPIPSIAGHSPPLDGKCDAPDVGAAVCAAGVCDSDGKCGLPDGVGPCTPESAAQVCRGGACTPGNVCTTPSSGGGCAGDVQCLSTQFCNAETKACVPKLANGEPVPTIAGHTPPLAGHCTDAAGKAACAAGVCDPADDKCGLADGDGPCSPFDGAVVCRTGSCVGTKEICGTAPPEPPPTVPTGCAFDSQCQAKEYCDTQATACKPKLDNGEIVPKIPGHSPQLSGVCAADVAQSVCASGVCDPADQRCGFRDGQGTCDESNGAVVCRSTRCEPPGVCAYVDDGALAGGGCSTAGDGETGRASVTVLGGLIFVLRGLRRARRRPG